MEDTIICSEKVSATIWGDTNTPRLEQAHRLIKVEDLDGALGLLDPKEILWEIKDNMHAREEDRSLLRGGLQALILRIDVLRAKGLTLERIEEICAIYEDVCRIAAEKQEWEWVMLYNYAAFLYELNNHEAFGRGYDILKHNKKNREKAIEIAERLNRMIETEAKAGIGREEQADVHHLLGLLYTSSRRFLEAEAAFVKAISLWETLRQEKSGYESELAKGYHDLGVLYLEDRDHALQEQGAESAFRRAIEIRRRLCELGTDACATDLAQSYERLASLLFTERRLEEAVALYEKAIGIWGDMLLCRPNTSVDRKVEICYRNAHMACLERLTELGAGHMLFGQIALKTKELLRSRVRLYSALAEVEPEKYELRLCEAYHDLVAECMRIFYHETKDDAFQAVTMYARQYRAKPDPAIGDALKRHCALLKNVYAFAPYEREREELEDELRALGINCVGENLAITREFERNGKNF